MDAELKAKLLDYLDTLEGAAKQGADFTAEQVPLAVQEYITFSIAWNSFVLALLVLAMVAVAVGYIAFWRYCTADCDVSSTRWDTIDQQFSRGIGGFVVAFVGVFLVGFAMQSLRIVLLASFAPRIFIIEAIADLVK